MTRSTPPDVQESSPHAEPDRKTERSAGRLLGQAALFVTITLALLMLLEGCSSTLLVFREWSQRPTSSTIRRYDPLLGWVMLPSLSRPDVWDGAGLRTNSRGFRGQHETSDRVPPGRIRVLCSGDSFALGERVGDEQAWCQRLTELDPRLETVNFGQSGYGIDQVYLRYVRDTAPLDYHMHLFTFIATDIRRTGEKDHHGYAKPYLELDADTLAVRGVPVPRVLPRLTRFSTWLSDHFRTLEVGGRIARRVTRIFASGPTAPADPEDLELQRIGPVAKELFRQTQMRNEEKNSVAVFVYLPVERELGEVAWWATSCRSCEIWRPWVTAVMDSVGYNFIDLTPALQGVPLDTAIRFFIPGDGHYSAAGNEWVAETLYDRLQQLPDVAALLASP